MAQLPRRYGRPWRDTEVVMLRSLAASRSVDDIAQLLSRTSDEVREMARQLKLPLEPPIDTIH